MAPMLPSASSPSYEALRAEIVALVGAGCSIAEIEGELATSELSSELSEEHSSALWLLAWSLRELPIKSWSPAPFEECPPPDHRLPGQIQGNWLR